jgi:hypothetical protein
MSETPFKTEQKIAQYSITKLSDLSLALMMWKPSRNTARIFWRF